ncbi:MAG: hypothetical protein LBG66_02645 [Gallionellaceae bacterium]|nr:hypothetical protein [Gallionellaceae bacterium]
MSHPLSERWDSFLARMEERFREMLPLAEQAAVDSLEQNGYDLLASSRTWMASKEQIRASLIERIDETWLQQVEPAMRATGGFWWVDEYQKGRRLHDALRDELDTQDVITHGKIAERYFNHAIRLMQKTFHCKQCGAPLDIPRGVFKSQYVPCRACQTVNTFMPETQYARAGHCADQIAAWRALPLYQAYQNSGNSREAALAYCTALIAEKAKMVELGDQIDEEIRLAMRHLGFDWKRE